MSGRAVSAPAADHAAHWFVSGRGLTLLWAGILAGPFAWAFDLAVSYAIVQWTCGSQHTSVLHLMTFVALAIVAGGTAAAWTALQHAPKEASDEGSRPFERGRFMAVLGLVLCATFAVLVVASAVPRFILDACQS
jgi:hypothetical protein